MITSHTYSAYYKRKWRYAVDISNYDVAYYWIAKEHFNKKDFKHRRVLRISGTTSSAFLFKTEENKNLFMLLIKDLNLENYYFQKLRNEIQDKINEKKNSSCIFNFLNI